MSDTKLTAAEPQLANMSISSEGPAKTANGAAQKFSWADDEEAAPNTVSANTASAKAADDNSLEKAQTDGASTWMQGSVGLDEPEFDVKVTLADLQANPDNPLFSVKTFEELNLWVICQTQCMINRQTDNYVASQSYWRVSKSTWATPNHPRFKSAPSPCS